MEVQYSPTFLSWIVTPNMQLLLADSALFTSYLHKVALILSGIDSTSNPFTFEGGVVQC